MSGRRKKEVTSIIQHYESTKRLATPPLQFRNSVDNIRMKKPLTAGTN
jgi:hypothetical protein